jgi:FAD synthase
LRETFPEELGDLKFRVMDAPVLGVNSTYVKRWSTRKESMTIILYRLPILRLGANSTPNEERLKIEHHVFEAAADLIGKEPWDLIFGED